MAACKCRKCQANLSTKNAYKTIINNRSAYFCNEEHYIKFIEDAETEAKKKEQNKQLQDKFYNLMCEILGVNGITNTALWKEKTEINKVFSDDVIVAYLDENKSWMTTSVSKLSGGIYGKIRYVSVILRNKLGDYRPKVVTREAVIPKIQDEHYETKFKLKQRRGFEDLEDDCDE